MAALVDSLYRKYPSGSLFLWEADKPIRERRPAIDGPIDKPLVKPLYLLDGQQRLTSLHRVYTGHERAQVVFNVETEKFQIESAATKRDPRSVLVHGLLSGATSLFSLLEEMHKRLPALSEEQIHDRLDRVKKIGDYVYYLEILESLPYEEVTEIFVRVNSRGKPLRSTDLAFATLSARWPGVVQRFDQQIEQCRAVGYRHLDATFHTRCLAAFVSDTASPKEFAVAALTDLEDGWKRVHRGVEHLVRLLQGHLLADTSELIPSVNALVPLVVYLGLRDDTRLDDETRNGLIYWLLGAWIQARYSFSSQTIITQDVSAVRSSSPLGRLYSNLGLVAHRLTVTDAMLAGRGSTSPYFFLSYVCARKRQACDWYFGVPVSALHDGSYKIEYHHIHPRATLKGSHGKADINDLSNLAFISAKANGKISDRSPSKYFPEVGDAELSRHSIPLDPALRTADHYPDFIRERRALLASAMTDLLEAFRPASLDEKAPSAGEPTVGEKLVFDIYGDSRDDDDIQIVVTAYKDGVSWRARTPFIAFTQMLQDVDDGLGAELLFGGETIYVPMGAESVDVQVGPLLASGSLEEWRKVMDRELDEMRPRSELPEVDMPVPWQGDPRPFPILDSE